jgi:hypothetical protein
LIWEVGDVLEIFDKQPSKIRALEQQVAWLAEQIIQLKEPENAKTEPPIPV